MGSVKAWQPFHSHKENGANSPSKLICFEKDKCSPSLFAYAYFYAIIFLGFGLHASSYCKHLSMDFDKNYLKFLPHNLMMRFGGNRFQPYT